MHDEFDSATQATSESTPAKLAVHPLESAAFDLNSVSSSSRIDTPNEVFEGPLELVHDCRDTAKVSYHMPISFPHDVGVLVVSLTRDDGPWS